MSGHGAPETGVGDLHVRSGEGAMPLREQVLDLMREAILEFRLAPGERLIERELMARTGVSRTTIREVIRQLAAEGLVRAIPQKGAVVSLLSTEEAADLYELRAAVEALAGRCFVRHATAAQVRALRSAHTRMKRVCATPELEMRTLLSAQDQFYGALLDGVRNGALRGTLAGLQARVRILRAGALALTGLALDR